MTKKTLHYSLLSKQELKYLKEFYVLKKIESMNERQLKDFAREIISHQINETIGDDEEIEAWKEIEDFFKTEFEEVVENIQKKFKTQNGLVDIEKLENQKRIELLEKNKLESEKIDMWEDEN